jgi:hypothetical protein
MYWVKMLRIGGICIRGRVRAETWVHTKRQKRASQRCANTNSIHSVASLLKIFVLPGLYLYERERSIFSQQATPMITNKE